MSRRSRSFAVLAVATVLAFGVAAWWGARGDRVNSLTRRLVLSLVRSAVAADVDIARVEVSFPPSVALHHVRVRVDGRTFLRVARARLDWAPLPLLRGRVAFRRAVIERPSLQAVRTTAGWSVPRLRPGGGVGAAFGLRIRRLEIEHGRVRVSPDGTRAAEPAVVSLDAVLGLSVGRGAGSLTITRLTARPRAGEFRMLRIAGGPIYFATAGSVCTGDLDIASERSRLAIAGCAGPGGVSEGRLVLEPLAAADLQALVPASPVRHDLHARVEADGEWSALGVRVAAELGSAGSLEADGSVVVGDAPSFNGRVRFAALDPGAILAGTPPARLNGDGRVRARARVGGSLDSLYRIRLAPSVVAERDIERGVVRGRHAGGIHRIRARADAVWGGGAARARIVAGERPGYRVLGHARITRMELLVPGMDGAGGARFSVEGEGTEATSARARLALEVRDAAVEGVTWTRASLRAALAEGTLRLDRLEVTGPDLDANGHAVIDLARRTAAWSLRADGEAATLSSIAGSGTHGRLRARLSGGGPFGALSIEATADGEGVAWKGVATRTLHLTGRVEGLGGARPAARARLEAAAVGVPGVEPRDATATAECTGTPTRGRCAFDVTGRLAESVTERLALTLSRDGGPLRGEIRDLRLTMPGGAVWALAAPARVTVGEDVSIDRLEVRAGRQRLALHGRVAGAGASDARLTLDDLALGPLCALRGPVECAGRISGRVALSGTAAAPVMDAAIYGERLVFGTLTNAELDVRVQYADRLAMLETVLALPPAGRLRGEMTVPVDVAWAGPRRDLSREPLSVAVSAQALDLEVLHVLAPRVIGAAAGTVSADIRGTGSRATPHAEGHVELRDASFTLTALGAPWHDVQARLVADGMRLRIDEMRARAGEGALHGSGYVSFEHDGWPRAFVDLRLQNLAAFQSPRGEAALEGEVRVRGPLAAPEVTGAVDVTRMVLRPPRLEAMITSLPEADPTIEVVGAVEEEVEVEGVSGGRLADPVRVHLRLRLQRDAWVRWREANVELGGELAIDKEPYEDAVITGTVVLRRGWYAFEGRRFELREGSITLGAAPGDVEVDITGVHRVRGYDVVARVRGPASAPELTLSSEPSLEEADVLSLLVFGKPASQLTQGQAAGLEEQTMRLAGQYVIRELSASVRDTLGLHTLEVELPEGQGGTGVVTAGRYVGRNVLVSLGQEFGASVAEVFRLEYALTSRISLRGSTTTTGRSGADIVWRYRY
jgi:autotransporter translocation and assembly factor TamB